MDIATALDALVPAAEYRGSLTANTRAAYNALVWTDVRAKPDWADIVSETGAVSKRSLAMAVNGYRDQIVAAGAPIDMGGGLALSIDLRNELDFRNIQALYSRALTAKLESETRQIQVRDADDQEHSLTVDQMIALGKAIVDRVDTIYRASWAVKAQIADGTLTDAADIPAAFTSILASSP